MTSRGDGREHPRARRTLARRLLLGIAIALAALLLLELGARLAYRGRWPYFFVHDPELGWAHRPGWSGEVRAGVRATFDARGLREERPLDGPRPHVLLLGDSVAFGYGLAQERTIARALERAARAAGRELTAINAGVPGYGTEQEVRLLERLGPALRPDVAALLFCLRNDLGVPPLDPTAAKDLAPRDALARALLDRSALAFALARVAHRRATRASREATDEGPSFLPPDAVAALDPAAHAAVFDVARARLRAFRDAARAHGARPLLVVCPEALLVGGQVPRERVVDPLLAIARELELPALDLLPALRAPAAGPLLREKDGVHPTEAGAERIAEAMLPAMP